MISVVIATLDQERLMGPVLSALVAGAVDGVVRQVIIAGTLAANDRNQLIYVPGLHNKLAAWGLQYLPHGLVRAIIRAGAEKYRLKP